MVSLVLNYGIPSHSMVPCFGLNVCVSNGCLQIVLASMDSQFGAGGNTLGALRSGGSWFVDKYLITSATSECDPTSESVTRECNLLPGVVDL